MDKREVTKVEIKDTCENDDDKGNNIARGEGIDWQKQE